MTIHVTAVTCCYLDNSFSFPSLVIKMFSFYSVQSLHFFFYFGGGGGGVCFKWELGFFPQLYESMQWRALWFRVATFRVFPLDNCSLYSSTKAAWFITWSNSISLWTGWEWKYSFDKNLLLMRIFNWFALLFSSNNIMWGMHEHKALMIRHKGSFVQGNWWV